MSEVIAGVALTALLGGLLIPFIQRIIERRSERFSSSVNLVDTLSASIWTYWKSALRVAYYGRLGREGEVDYERALTLWDGDEAWRVGLEIQIQVSRSKRLLPPEAHRQLNIAQQKVVDYLDQEIEKLRRPPENVNRWEELYHSLMVERRREIDSLLTDVVSELR